MPPPAQPSRPDRVLVEVAVDSLAGARAAAQAGADRLELCSHLPAGGLTPGAGLLEAVRAAVAVPVFAMVRPRAGGFRYDRDELATIRAELRAVARGGADGVVFGALTAAGAVDREAVAALREVAAPLPVTFHRAFDRACDPAAALEDLIALGVARVLTSGQSRAASEGSALLANLVALAGGRIAVVAGGGVRAANVAALVAATGVREVHLSAAARRAQHGAAAAGAFPGDEPVCVTDGDEVARVVAALRPAQ